MSRPTCLQHDLGQHRVRAVRGQSVPIAAEERQLGKCTLCGRRYYCTGRTGYGHEHDVIWIALPDVPSIVDQVANAAVQP